MADQIEELEEIRQRIFKKLEKMIRQLQTGSSTVSPEPDVIVIEDDQSLLFEAQNRHAWRLLARGCGYPDGDGPPDRIRVHHCRSQQIIRVLEAAGATVCTFGSTFPNCHVKNLEANDENGHNPLIQNKLHYAASAPEMGNFPKAIHENS